MFSKFPSRLATLNVFFHNGKIYATQKIIAASFLSVQSVAVSMLTMLYNNHSDIFELNLQWNIRLRKSYLKTMNNKYTEKIFPKSFSVF